MAFCDPPAPAALTIDDFALGEDYARVVEIARRALRSTLPVLIEGEAGTGRSALATAIAGAAGQPVLLCDGALPAPGAPSPGVLIVDAVETLPAAAQAALFEALSADAGGLAQGRRVIAIGPSDLLARVAAGDFREDLYYRLGALAILMPPLRRARHALAPLAQRLRGAPLGAAALQQLCAHDWPGNIAELAQVLRAAALVGRPDTQTFALPERRADATLFDGPAMLGMPHTTVAQGSAPSQAMLGIQALDEGGEVRALDAIEADMIRLALAHYRGHMTEIARRLGIGRSTLYRKMRDLGIDDGAHLARG